MGEHFETQLEGRIETQGYSEKEREREKAKGVSEAS